MFVVLKAGQTRLRCQHVNRRAFSLYIENPQLHRVQLRVLFPKRAIRQEGCRHGCIFSTGRRGAMFWWR